MKKIILLFLLVIASTSFTGQQELNDLFDNLSDLEAAATAVTAPPAAVLEITAVHDVPIILPSNGSYPVDFNGQHLIIEKDGLTITISSADGAPLFGNNDASKNSSTPPPPKLPAQSAKDLQSVANQKPIAKNQSINTKRRKKSNEETNSKPKLSFLEEIAAKAQAKEEAAVTSATAATEKAAVYPIINKNKTQVTFLIGDRLDLKNGLITRDKMKEIDDDRNSWLEQEEETTDGVPTVTFTLDDDDHQWDGEPYNLIVKEQDDSSDDSD